jgi:hypothetical protein
LREGEKRSLATSGEKKLSLVAGGERNKRVRCCIEPAGGKRLGW